MTTSSSETGARALLGLAAVLWLLWGLVHTLAGIMTLAQDTPQAIVGIADAVDASTLPSEYPPAVGAIINQHGFNLLWIGGVTTVCSWFVWRRSRTAVLLAALVGGLADVGYFLFLDLGGFVHFLPGTLMTLFSATAITASFFAIFGNASSSSAKSDPSAPGSSRTAEAGALLPQSDCCSLDPEGALQRETRPCDEIHHERDDCSRPR